MKKYIAILALFSISSTFASTYRCSGKSKGQREDLFILYNNQRSIQMLSGGTEYMYLGIEREGVYSNEKIVIEFVTDTKVVINKFGYSRTYTNVKCEGAGE